MKITNEIRRLLLFGCLFFTAACDEIDTCLDRGGAWDDDANECIWEKNK